MDDPVRKTIEGIREAATPSGWTGVNAPDRLEIASGLWVTKAGARLFPGGFRYDPEKNSHWEWGAVISGGFEFAYGGGAVRAAEGCSYVMPPDVLLSARPVGDPFLVWLEAAGPNADGAFARLGGRRNEVALGRFTREQVKTVLRIAKLLHEHPYGYGLNVQAGLWSFFACSVYPESLGNDRISLEIRQALDYLDGGASGRCTLERLARLAGLPPETFRKRFRRETGESPVTYMLRQRMRRAKEMLSRKDLSVKQAAAEAGFDDPYYFSRLFKKYEGLSPAEFRKRFYPELFL